MKDEHKKLDLLTLPRQYWKGITIQAYSGDKPVTITLDSLLTVISVEQSIENADLQRMSPSGITRTK